MTPEAPGSTQSATADPTSAVDPDELTVDRLEPASLTIGDLAERTGLAPATLRMWEQRHGFPTPERIDSGHRRYTEGDVVTVREVVRRRDAGTRLDVAIAQSLTDAVSRARPDNPSVFATLRQRHPGLMPYRLRKSTLLSLSWAIEDEFCARASHAHLFGGFQRAGFYELSRSRWDELARVARSSFVFADFADVGDAERSAGGPVIVALPEDAPMRREWVVVCDAREASAALSAWELPGQDDVPDGERLFEALWTVDPVAVRDAARVCAGVAARAGAPEAAPVLFDLADSPASVAADLASVTTLFNRVVAYVDSVRYR